MNRFSFAPLFVLVLVFALALPVSAGAYSTIEPVPFNAITFSAPGPGNETIGGPTGEHVNGKIKTGMHHGHLRINAHLDVPGGNVFTVWAFACAEPVTPCPGDSLVLRGNAAAADVNANGRWNFKADVAPDVVEIHLINHGPDIGVEDQYLVPWGGCKDLNPDYNDCSGAVVLLP